jgi:hypothetical protein
LNDIIEVSIGISSTAVILAGARIQIAQLVQTSFCKTFLYSSLRWNDVTAMWDFRVDAG